MEKCTSAEPQVTVGLDISDKSCHMIALDQHGEIVEEARMRTSPPALRRRFDSMGRARIALEVGTHSPWVSRLLEECGHEVLVANPRRLRLIYGSHKKTDRTDAESLARLARVDPKLLSPIQHRGLEAQRALSMIRARVALVRSRTLLVNHIRGAVKAFGGRIPKCSTESFHNRAPDHIPEELRRILGPIVETIKDLTSQIRQYDRAIDKLCEEKYPETGCLRQVKGVGPVTSAAYVLVLEDPRRFEASRTVGAYVGLVPRKDESGESSPQLRITKAGDPLLRSLLVGSAQYILGPFGPDTDLRRHGRAIAARGGKNAKKRAVVAVARKLAVLLHHLWATGEVYEPLRNTKRKKKHAAVTGVGS